jgi:nucleoside-diphosphate-sugar epimerase
MPKILVTGGYGFIGTHFLIRLLEDTDFVVYNVIVNLMQPIKIT